MKSHSEIRISIPFFIDQLRKMNRVGFAFWVYESSLCGLCRNPDFRWDQFLELHKTVPPAFLSLLLGYYTDGHTQRDDLDRILSFGKEFEPNSYSAWGKKLLNSQYGDIRSSVITYFSDKKNDHSVEAQTCYDFFISDQIKNEKDLDKYDEYVNQYTGWAKGKSDDEILKTLSKNRNLDDPRIKRLFDRTKKLNEDYRTDIIKNLLSCPNISKDTFEALFNSRKTLKRSILNAVYYMGVAANPTHIHDHFEFLFKYIKGSTKLTGPQSDVLAVLCSNPSLTNEELDGLISVLEGKKEGTLGFPLYSDIASAIILLFKRDDLSQDMVDRLLNVFLRASATIKKEIDKGNTGKMRTDVFRDIKLNDAVFDLIIKMMKKNPLKCPILASLFQNKGLSQEQYDWICSILTPIFFKDGILLLIHKHPQDDALAPHEVLLDWASCPYVKN